jgi:hypothetical protein
MSLYVHGRTLPPPGTAIRGSTPHLTINEALEEARMVTSLNGAVVWISDHNEKLIMNAAAVQQALKKPKSN